MEKERAAYEGYASFTGGKTFDGRDMPTWDNLTPRIRDAWRAAIHAAEIHASEIELHSARYALERLRINDAEDRRLGCTRDWTSCACSRCTTYRDSFKEPTA